MTLRQRLGLWLLKRSIGTAPWLTSPSEVGRPTYNPWSMEKAMVEGYQAHSIVYLCIRRISQSFASVPWSVGRETSSGMVDLPNHPGTKLLSQPNPYWSLQDLMEVLPIDLNLGGNAYWLFLRMGKAMELWRLRPDRMRAVPGPGGEVRGYEYRVGTTIEHLPGPIEENGKAVIHFRLLNPGNDFSGLAPLQAASRIVDADNQAIDWNYQSMLNQARPSGGLSTAETLSDASYARLRAQIDEMIAGSTNARRPVLLEGGMTWQQFGMSPTEMDFLESRRWTARELCAVFGVQPEWIGLVDATYENKRQARRATWEDTIVPALYDVRSTMNMVLMPLLRQDGVFNPDTSQTPAMTDARAELLDQAKILWSMGVPLNQANEHLGLGMEPVEGGDIGYLPVGVLPVGEASDTGEASPPPKDDEDEGNEEEGRSYNLSTESQRTQYWRAFDRKRISWERVVTARLKKRFKEERDAVLKVLEEGGWESTITKQKTLWKTLLMATWRAVIDVFGESAAKDFGMETKSRAVWDPWPKWAASHIEAVVADKVVGILAETKEQIKSVVAKGVEEAWSSPQVARAIRDLYEEKFMLHRAYVIARTEVGGAANYGTSMAAQESGVVKTHTWVSSRDGRVRDSHQVINGQTRKLKTKYSNGLSHPCDPMGAAAEVIQCRCVETYGT